MKLLIYFFIVFTFLILSSCKNEIDIPVSTNSNKNANTDNDCCAFTVRAIVQQFDGYNYVNCMDRTFVTSNEMTPNCDDFYWFVTYYMQDNYRIICNFSYIPDVVCMGYFGIFTKPEENTQPVFYTYLPYNPDQSYVEQTFYINDLEPNGTWYYSKMCVFPFVIEKK